MSKPKAWAPKFTVKPGGSVAPTGIGQAAPKPKEKTYSGSWDIRIYVEGELKESLQSACLSEACIYIEKYSENFRPLNMFAIVQDNGYAIAFIRGKGWSDDG